MYLYIFLVLAVLGLAYMRFETTLVKVERIKFTESKNHLKVIQISDIHVNHLKVSADKVKKVIDSENPDLIILTGDYIEKPKHISIFLDFVDKIKNKDNVYLCLGNHDHKAFLKDREGLDKFIAEMEVRRINVLHNRAICYEKNFRAYNLIGIADLKTGSPDLHKALSTCHNQAVINIGISHNPDIVLKIPENRIDYLFCGHFHGGQIWMPFNLEFKLLRNEKLCDMGIRRGLHKVNGINLYISRGLGNVLFPFRFFSRPEITVIHLP
ncbi:MAG: metallophosphoesterase [Clostridia bacterium]|nr:metallophosphoesterase [Clostridia bacterium]